jgi:uncharacterized protein (DUF2249 family)
VTRDRRLVPANEGTEDADSQLLWEAIARSEALLEDLAADEVSTPKFDAFLGYLYEIVLARTSEEELELLPALRAAGPFTRSDADRLHQDHLLIRNDIEQLAAASAQNRRSPEQLTALIRRLIVRLEEHLRAEAAARSKLPDHHERDPDWAKLGHWFPLTEGPLIDLDQLSPLDADDAVLNRLTHLRPHEQVELSSRNGYPQHLWSRLQRRAPGAYSWSERGNDANGWTVVIKRRRVD